MDDVVRVAAAARAFGSSAEVLQYVEEMRGAARTIQEVVKDLRVFARADDGESPQVVNVPSLIEQILRLVGREILSTAIIERDYGAGIPDVLVAHARLTQVLTNVLVNTTHALREATRTVHRVRITLRADEDTVAISISDTGPGIPPSALERIFDPFYTTKRANLGTGLGLSISRNLMRRMGGDLLVESVFGEGATFIVLVPRASAAEVRAAQIRARIIPTLAPPKGRPSVLVVDANDQMLRAYSRVLGRRFDLLLASDSQEAIEMLSSGSSADVVLADLGLSPLDGAHLHQWLLENQPELARRTVFVAAEPEQQRARPDIAALANEIMPKPTPAVQLVTAIENAAKL
jgi:two-component system, NtrC family, sensor kinase